MEEPQDDEGSRLTGEMKGGHPGLLPGRGPFGLRPLRVGLRQVEPGPPKPGRNRLPHLSRLPDPLIHRMGTERKFPKTTPI